MVQAHRLRQLQLLPQLKQARQNSSEDTSQQSDLENHGMTTAQDVEHTDQTTMTGIREFEENVKMVTRHQRSQLQSKLR